MTDVTLIIVRGVLNPPDWEPSEAERLDAIAAARGAGRRYAVLGGFDYGDVLDARPEYDGLPD